MKIPQMRLILVILVLVGASLACNFPGSAAQPTLPPTAQPMTNQQIQDLTNQLQSTLTSPNASGEVTVTLTQQQLNGIISNQVAQQSDQVISDPSVILTNGQMEVYGKVSQNNVSANLKLVLQPAVDASGNPKLNIVSINLAGLPVPDALKSRLETSVDNALSNALESNQNKFTVKSITITEGQMVIIGTPQRP